MDSVSEEEQVPKLGRPRKPRGPNKLNRPVRTYRRRNYGYQADIADQVIKNLQAGHTVSVACRLANMHPQRHYEWVRKGEEQTRGVYREYHDAYHKALAEAEVPLLMTARRCATGGMFRLRLFDVDGQQMFNEDGSPKYRTVTLLPDGRLALQILQIRNPRDYGGLRGQPQIEEIEARHQMQPGETINLVREALLIMQEHGLPLTVEMPTGSYKALPEQSALPEPEVDAPIRPRTIVDDNIEDPPF